MHWIQKLSAGNEVIKLTLAGFFSQHCPFFTQQYLREYRHFWLDFLVIVINTIIILIFIILTLLCRAWHIWEVPWQWRWRPLVGRSTRRSHQSSLRGPVDPPDVKVKVLSFLRDLRFEKWEWVEDSFSFPPLWSPPPLQGTESHWLHLPWWCKTRPHGLPENVNDFQI